MSHDLKNPLGVIDSLAELMLDGNAGPLNPQQAGSGAPYSSQHAAGAHAVSQNLIDAERVEAGQLVLQRRRTARSRGHR